MDAFSVWHNNLTNCRELRDHTSDTQNGFSFIKSAALFLLCDNFYMVLLLFYSLPISGTSL